MIRILLVVLCLLLPCVNSGAKAAEEQRIVVFAAASIKNALDDVDAAFTRRTGVKVVTSYAASSALVKQIEQGAPADLFISADRDWMDYASQHRLIRDASRLDLLGNRLVLIAPKSSAPNQVTLDSRTDLAQLAHGGRIAVGDVRAVPAGKYAKTALEKLGLWDGEQKSLAMTENVRVALALVARGEAALGIVYETDAKIEPNVRVVGVFPADSDAPIVYPAALTIGARPAAAPFLDYLRSAEARSIFEHYGFTDLLKARM
ncbi:MAG TPA: molybdate ABC transporter substrate-binding protein [Xanthobacteraceae bacterium]|nr:molybdate ABC transporter substrate-binding protein [Xanthobacteraceae bacterium]